MEENNLEGRLIMENCESIVFDTCEDLKCVESTVRMDPEGHLLLVPVCLKHVRPNRALVVGVEVYLDKKLYALKTRKVFTGHTHAPKKYVNFMLEIFTFYSPILVTKTFALKY